MKNIKDLYNVIERPIKVIQFGEGNFLRAFTDYAIDIANETLGFNGNIVIVLPRSDKTAKFDKQNCIYTVAVRGRKNGNIYEENRVITSIAKTISAVKNYSDFMELSHIDTLEFVVSNTTEAGIVFNDSDKLEDSHPSTFPAKLTKFLYERYNFFNGSNDKGLIMLPAELIEKNGETLKKCIIDYCTLWKLSEDFIKWVNNSCKFVSTLVDRIVTGYPKDKEIIEKLGYEDELLTAAEPFGLWVIEDPSISYKFNISSDKLNVEFTDNINIFKERKVRILNGAHTSMALGAYLYGMDYVKECMDNKSIRKQLEQCVFEEIVPTVHLSEEFAHSIFERFENPFIKHSLLSISLNSISKWKSRVLPTLKDSISNTGKFPKWLSFSFASLSAFYRSTEKGDNCLIGKRGNDNYEIRDDSNVLEFFANNSNLDNDKFADILMKQINFWGEDLSAIHDSSGTSFKNIIVNHLNKISEIGIKKYIDELVS